MRYVGEPTVSMAMCPLSYFFCHKMGPLVQDNVIWDSMPINKAPCKHSDHCAYRCAAGVECKSKSRVVVSVNKDRSLLLPGLTVSSVIYLPSRGWQFKNLKKRAPDILPQTCFTSIFPIIIYGNYILLKLKTKPKNFGISLDFSLFLMFCRWWTSKSCWVCLQNISRVWSPQLTSVNFYLDYWKSL